VPDAEIDCLYAAFLSDVEAVQAEQKAVLRCLIEHHGLHSVFQEGLSQPDMPVYRVKLRVLRGLEGDMAGLRDEHAEVARALSGMKAASQEGTADYRELAKVEREIEDVLQAYRLDLLRIGAAGQLHVSGVLHEVLPLDDAGLLDEADPVTEAGRVDLNPAAIEARQDAQVRTLLEAGPFAFVILGGAHDLEDNIAGQSDGCEYVVVTTREYRRAAEGTPPVADTGRSQAKPSQPAPDPIVDPRPSERA